MLLFILKLYKYRYINTETICEKERANLDQKWKTIGLIETEFLKMITQKLNTV